jgi:hypothetical protein
VASPVAARARSPAGWPTIHQITLEAIMNVWKPLAIFSTSALVLVASHQVASAMSKGSAETSVEGDYRRMHAGLDSLRVARDHLMNAEHNHGGWRERAVEATDHAIHETETAINWNP